MSLVQGQRLNGLQAELSLVRVIDPLLDRTPILRLPGGTQPGRVYFQVNDPGDNAFSNAVITVERERSRTTGIQQFTVGSSGAGISPNLYAGAILGGGSADFSGGISVFAEEMLPGSGVTASIRVWVDYSEGIQTSHDRAPVTYSANIPFGTSQDFGAVPAGCRFVQIMTNAGSGAAGLAANWRDANNALVANFNQWAGAAPVLAPSGLFLRLFNGAAAGSLNVGVVYS